jgi:GR25 family glycosyltransferase involved in LPS biosynthesis
MSINGIDIIYWINLDRSKERRTNMEKIFADECFKDVPVIQRFSAVDGKKPGIIDKYIRVDDKTINDAEYGCLLSHLEVIREFSQSSYDIALVMEDDVTLDFKKYWKKDLKTIIGKAPADWDIIMLSYISNELPPNEFTLNENKYWSTLAYIINNKAAKKLINEIYIDGKYNIETYINNEADQYIYQKVTTYTYRYPLFIYKYNEESTLHQGAIERHNISRNRIEDMYIDKPNIMEGFTTQYGMLGNYLLQNIIFIIIFFIALLAFIYVLITNTSKRKYNKMKIYLSNLRKYLIII